MSLEVNFAFVCRKKFEELKGESQSERFCDSCNINVINLDPLNDRERLELFERTAASPQRLCVAATVLPEFARTCSPPQIPPPHMGVIAGNLVHPTPEQLKQERERIDRLRLARPAERGWVSKLLSTLKGE